jgi:diguanylate cyclase (GGDEF)-like protein
MVRIDGTARRDGYRFALAVKAANDGLWDWNLRSNTLLLSSRWLELLGIERETVGDGPEEWFGRVHRDDLAGLQYQFDRLLTGNVDSVEFDCRMRHVDGDLRSMRVRAVAVRGLDGVVYRAAGSHTDVTSEVRLLRSARHDSLTHLPNGELFRARLRRAFERARSDPTRPFAVLFVDVDHFKEINDRFGHEAGDAVLLSLAVGLGRCIRASDTFARVGGDEFAVLVEDMSELSEVGALAKRMLASVDETFSHGEDRIAVTVSIGIARFEAFHDTPEEVLHAADTAMYRAKALGRARFAVFENTMDREASRDLRVANVLAEARRLFVSISPWMSPRKPRNRYRQRPNR